jgi:predicted RecB family nuclease
MKLHGDKILLYPTDLSNHLSCAHITELERQVALGLKKKPIWHDPSLAALQERGVIHEKSYVDHLRGLGLHVTEMGRYESVHDTVRYMEEGADVIVQAALTDDDWTGKADILIKVRKPSRLGDYSYEVQDTKLAVDTKAGTILQLMVYSDIVSAIQNSTTECIHVVKPGDPFAVEKFRYDDFKAYYRQVKGSMLRKVAEGPQKTYPEPVDQCSVCRWWKECDDKRRGDDHLSLIAGISRMHIGELNKHEILKLEEFAKLDVPLKEKPQRGRMESFIKVHEQAKLQWKGKGLEKPMYELLDVQEKKGFNRMPPPDAGDVYFDFEGDPYYADGGLEYLFGIVYYEDAGWKYKKWWALNRREEKKAFNEFMTFIMHRWANSPGMHIYHYSPYEPAAIKRLMSRFALHEVNVDNLLRHQRFVDLYSIVREILRASVESYSIKSLEKLAGFARNCKLEVAGPARRTLEYTLEFRHEEAIDSATIGVVEEYNADDCYATHALHHWLEKVRTEQLSRGGILTRPDETPKEQDDKRTVREKELQALYLECIAGIPEDGSQRSDEEKARWLLAHLIHYFDRERKNAWWEFFRIHKMDPDDLFQEKSAITGLTFLEELPKKPKQRNQRYKYTYPPQEVELDVKSVMHTVMGDKLGVLEEIDVEKRIIVISQPNSDKPADVHGINIIESPIQEDSLLAFVKDFKANGNRDTRKFKAGTDLLMRREPDFAGRREGEKLISDGSKVIERAIEIASGLNESVLAIQGPPGTGKTYTGAKIILALLKTGKKIGVTAVSHKVIRNLLDKVYEFAAEERLETSFKYAHKTEQTEDCPAWLTEISDNSDAINALVPGTVLGATSFLWARPDAEVTLDYLFVDEAGQMSLANVLAASRCTSNIILLGDPQQLEQPQKGAHPEGADTAALTHLMGDDHTIGPTKGIFLGTTHRLHPDINAFTSEVYYENRLTSLPELRRQIVKGGSPFDGSGLFYVTVKHSDRQTHCPEEIEIIRKIATGLLQSSGTWTNRNGEVRPISPADILIVAPYNAQVRALTKALPNHRIGTVDKFQGQEAAIVIYSMTCSSAEDAPRGMGFLYSPNRLNVATSRAKSVCILVSSPGIFEAECRTIEQMKWVNGVCRYRELAASVDLAK